VIFYGFIQPIRPQTLKGTKKNKETMSQIPTSKGGGFYSLIKQAELDNIKNNNGFFCVTSWLGDFVAKTNQAEWL